MFKRLDLLETLALTRNNYYLFFLLRTAIILDKNLKKKREMSH